MADKKLTNELMLKPSQVANLIQSIHTYNRDLANNSRAARHEEPIVPYIRSHPGIGKTSLAWQAADKMGSGFTGFILAQYDPAELAGFIFFDRETRETWRAKPDFLPKEGEHIVLCDEFAQATMMQKNVMAQLIQERRLGEHSLSPHATLILAGNNATDRAGVQPDPSHVLDRVMTIGMVADREDWAKWAWKAGVHPSIINFLAFRESMFDQFDPGNPKNATPRGWTKVSTLIGMGLEGEVEMAAIQGQVGPGPAADFHAFLKVFRDLPSVDRVLADPAKHPIPSHKDKPDVLYALCGAISAKADKRNISNVLTFAGRLPGEFTVMCVRDAVQRDGTLVDTKEITKWLATTGANLTV